MINQRQNLILKLTKNLFNTQVKNRFLSTLTPILTKTIAQNNSQSQLESQLFVSKLSTSSTSQAKSNEQAELIIQNLNEGIVELQLNRSLGKNSLSKKLLFEVRS